MARKGLITVEYLGRIPEGLREHLDTVGVRVSNLRPLTLVAARPEATLNQIWRYLSDSGMQVQRVRM